MKKHFILLMMSALLFPGMSFSADKSISCKSPQGMRVDYYLNNPLQIENEKFHVGRDQLKDATVEVVIKENKQDATLTINGESSEMKIMMYNVDQISFVGFFDGVPILATYYPLEDVIYFTQQSVWPGGEYIGTRTQVFFAKCKVS